MSMLPEETLIQKAQAGDIAARNALLERHLRFVYKLATRFLRKSPRLELDDLVSFGILGFIRAIEKFDIARGVKLTTYAAYWIHRSMQDAMISGISALHVPNLKSDTLALFYKQRERTETRDELIDSCVSASHRVRSRESAALLVDALTVRAAPLYAEEYRLTNDIESPEEAADRRLTDERVRLAFREACGHLPSRSVDMWTSYFEHGKSLREIGERYGLSRERVRQILGEMRMSLQRLMSEWKESA